MALTALHQHQGRLRHQTTHPSHYCTLDPGLDTLICLTCGFNGSDVVKQLAQPCSGAANQAGRDNLSRVDRGLMPGSSKAAPGTCLAALSGAPSHTVTLACWFRFNSLCLACAWAGREISMVIPRALWGFWADQLRMQHLFEHIVYMGTVASA